eukprot:5773084-Alexandrium_andersonii.AAC.1
MRRPSWVVTTAWPPDPLAKVSLLAPNLTRGGHGPGSTSGPNDPVRCSESAKDRALATMQIWAPEAPRREARRLAPGKGIPTFA